MPFRSRLARLGPGCALALLLAACAGERPGADGALSIALDEEQAMLDAPADTGSAEPYLIADEGGSVYLSWLGRAASGERALFVVRGRGNRFEPPAVITAGDSLFANWADTPGLAIAGRQWVAWWLVRQDSGYAYHARIAVSRDEGRTWSAPRSLHEDASLTEHGFVSAAAQGDEIVLAWLDGRNFAGAEAHGHGHGDGAGPEMQLRSARIGADGQLRDERVLDPRVCDCCQTAAAALPGGVLVAYRDRSSEEIRDVGVTRLDNGAWSEPRVALADGWKIPGCPVNGPALDARGERVAMAWFTASGDSARVLAALSPDGGRTWGEPRRIDEGNPAGRADVALLEDGSALVTWIESATDTAHLMVRRITDTAVSPRRSIALVSTSRRSGFPRLAVARGHAYFAWTEVGPPSRVRLSRVRLLSPALKNRVARGRERRGTEG